MPITRNLTLEVAKISQLHLLVQIFERINFREDDILKGICYYHLLAV